jgi:hypothetical protein
MNHALGNFWGKNLAKLVLWHHNTLSDRFINSINSKEFIFTETNNSNKIKLKSKEIMGKVMKILSNSMLFLLLFNSEVTRGITKHKNSTPLVLKNFIINSSRNNYEC